MSIVAADLQARGCVNSPEDDVVTAGGAISITTELRIVSDLDPTADLQVNSTVAGDTSQTLNARCRNAAGVLGSYSTDLAGTTLMTLAPVGSRRLESMTLTAVAVGTVTIRETAGPSQGIITNGSLYLRSHRLFINSASAVSGTVVRYDKTFWRNGHATLAALAPVYRLTADPTAIIRQGIHTSVGDTVTITNRLTTPGGITFVDDNVDQVGGQLTAGSSQGVWWEQTATAGSGPFLSNFTTQITVSSI